ncbi:MAG: hypothetical protein ACLQVD_06460 [Capsulimonadaceae bacterium]
MEPLKEERDFFASSLPEWMKLYSGRVALVKGQELVGVFDTEGDALSEGARQFGMESFLVRRVVELPEDIRIPALVLGILSGNPSSTSWTTNPA